jgi:hypothetical protein
MYPLTTDAAPVDAAKPARNSLLFVVWSLIALAASCVLLIYITAASMIAALAASASRITD